MIRWLALFVLLAFATSVAADELRPGYLELTQKDAQRWSLIWKAPMRGGVTPATRPVLPAGCAITGTPTRERVGQAAIMRASVRCRGGVAGSGIGLDGFEASQTDVLVRVAQLDRPVQTLRLTASEPVARIAADPERFQVGWTYLVIGIEHIIFGFDHLLFVLCMVILLGQGWSIAKAVTAFTIAHSITLVGATLGFMGLAQRPVEAMIALSIVFLAVEIIKQRSGEPRLSERLPWLVAFLFGLLHGFGFAGALSEVGLPEGEVPMALFAFNIGVEIGQLAIVAVALAVIAALRRVAPVAAAPALKVVTYAIGITASVWLFERVVV